MVPRYLAILALVGALLLAAGGARTQPASAPAAATSAPTTAPLAGDRSDATIALEIQALLAVDDTIVDEVEQTRAILDNLKKVPALIEEMDKSFPGSKYRAAAHSLGIDALLMRRKVGDPQATTAAVAAAADKMLAASSTDLYRCKAKFIALQVAALDALDAATVTTQTASRPAKAIEQTCAVAEKFVRLAEEYPHTELAPDAMYLAAGLYLEMGRADSAITVYERLLADHPKDSSSLKAMMVLVQLYDQRNPAKAMDIKRRCVAQFPDSTAAMKYKADIAQADCLGKPFILRFRSVQGDKINLRDYKGKPVLVYFAATLADAQLGPGEIKTLAGLAALATDRGAGMLAVSADKEEDGPLAAAALAIRKVAVPLLIDPDNKVATQYGVLILPAVAVVDADGNLRDVLSDANMAAAVKKSLATLTTQPATATAPSPAGK
jgi:peroxiredoxin/TolA-binding protein